MCLCPGFFSTRCAIPGVDNDTFAVQNEAHRWLINRTIPMDGNKYSSCKIYTSASDNISYSDNRPNISCEKWVFDKSVFESTTTEKMGLVCSQLIKRSHLNSIYQGGVMVGALVLGNSADIFGRKKVMYFSVMAGVLVGILSAFVPEYISFCFSRFFLGALGAGYFLNAFTIGIELVGPSFRMWTGMIIEIFWVVGEAILVLLAYLIRDWQNLKLALFVPGVLYISLWWLIPESPRWLIANGRTAEAEKILKRAAQVNKKTLPDHVFGDKIQDDDSLPSVKIWKMFTHPTLLIRSLIIFFNWCVSSMVYYGLSLNSAYLYGGVHLNFFLSVVVELVAYLLCLPLLNRIGRKALHATSMLIGGVACCCSIFTVLYLPAEYQWATTVLSLIGKLGASAAFAVIYIFTSELFPTVVRNGGMGFSSTFARVGSMTSPYIAELGNLVGGSFAVALPLIVFGGASIAAGISSLWLPETLNRILPETIEDAITFGKDSNKKEKSSGPITGVSLKKLDFDNPAVAVDDETGGRDMVKDTF